MVEWCRDYCKSPSVCKTSLSLKTTGTKYAVSYLPTIDHTHTKATTLVKHAPVVEQFGCM
jgi:hypothetical protein